MKSFGLLYLTVLVILLAFVVATFAPAVKAQSNLATLTGTVTDPSGALIPDVNITLVNVDTNMRRQTLSSKEGQFTLPQLKPGKYRLRAEHEGFAVFEVSDIVLNTADRRDLQVRLKVGMTSQSVTVEARAVEVETGGGAATLVDRVFVETTALNGRSFQALLLMTPGAVLDGGPISFDGMRSDMNYFTVDGISANSGANNPAVDTATSADTKALTGAVPNLNTYGGTQSMLSLDAMQEFKVQTSAMSAQYGRQAGAQVQLTSRSGTNAYHGTLAEYLRNDALDAKPNYPLAPTNQKPKLRQNNYGATVGGPIVPSRTFFFVSYEGQQNVLPQASNLWTVPSVALRNGDPALLATWMAANYPTRVTATSAMPASVMALLKMFPLPNIPCGLPAGLPANTPLPTDPRDCLNVYTYSDAITPSVRVTKGLPAGYAYWQGSIPQKRSMSNWSLKLDHTFSQKLTGFMRYSYSFSDGKAGLSYGPQVERTISNWTRMPTLGFTWAPSKKVVNTFRGNFTVSGGGAAYGAGNIHDGGILPGPNPILDGVMASAADGQITPLALAYPATINLRVGRERQTANRQWNLVDDLSWLHGKHSLKFGIDWRYLFPNMPAYSATVTTLANNVPDAYSNTIYSMTESAVISTTVVTQNYSAYVQDSWRVGRQLTLDLGLRWELNPAPHGTRPTDLRYITGWDQASTLAMAPPGARYYDTPWRQFAPRLGVSYQVGGKARWQSVVRGGWGLFYDFASNGAMRTLTFFPSVMRSTPVAFDTTPVPSINDIARYLAMAPPPANVAPPYPAFQSYVGRMDKLGNLPKSYKWNISWEQSLGRLGLLTSSYVGNIGRDLIRVQYLYEDGSRGTTNSDFVNPNFSSGYFNIYRNDGDWADRSSYNALQIQFQRPMRSGLQVLANWTWGHTIDTGSSQTATVTQWQPPPKDRGNANFDRRHIVNVIMTWEPKLAVGLGSASAPLAVVVRNLVNGWSLNSNFKAQSATPMTVTILRSMMPYDAQSMTVRADIIPGQPLWISSPAAPSGKYLNPDAFAPPAPCMTLYPQDCQNGNSMRNGIRGFGFWQQDASVRRTISVSERVRMQISGEFFNLLNHPNWANPLTSLGSITTSYNTTTKVPTATTFTRAQVGPNLGQTRNNLADSILGGLISMYQMGGARSIQLGLKLTF